MSRLFRVLAFCLVLLHVHPAKTQSCCGNNLTEQFNNHYLIDTLYAENSILFNGIITFSSSMLFPSFLVDQLLPFPVLAFNNKQDPYEVPIDQLAPWWSINACATFYPHAAGWSSSEVSSLMDSGGMQHVIYNEAACAHNLHHPCFPFWQEEIETMSQFMQDKMDCTFPLSQTKITLNESNQVIVCYSLSQLKEIMNKHKQAHFVSLTGQELKPENLFDSEGGIYYLITPDSTIRIAVVQ